MKKKQIVKLNESQLRRIVSESVTRVLKENENDEFLEIVDKLVYKCSPFYKKYIKLDKQIDNIIIKAENKGYEIDPNDEHNTLVNKIFSMRDEQHKCLQDIIGMVNEKLGGNVLQFEDSYYEADPFWDGFSIEDGDMWSFEEGFCHMFLSAICNNVSFSSLYAIQQGKKQEERDKREDSFKKEQNKQLDFWKKRGINAQPKEFFGSDFNVDSINDYEMDKRLTYMQGKYDTKTTLPNVLGKIDLPKEPAKKTKQRKMALNK